MIKLFKKHCKKLIIASSVLTACVCGLFGFTKSYAYSENQNGELVGNNLITSSNVSNITMNASFTNISGSYNYSPNGNFYFNVDFSNYQGSDQVNLTLDFEQFMPSYFFDKKFSLGFLVESDNFSIGSYQTSIYATGSLRRNGTTSDYASQVILNESFISGYNGSIKKCYFMPYDTSNWNSYPNSHFKIFLRINNNSNNIVNGGLKFTFFMFENSTLNELSFNSNVQTFYPYSSIAELEYNYQQLQQQYNTYVSNHTYTDTQYNDLVSANSSLQQQLSTLQLQYNTYVATHTHTDTEYNNLLEGYDDLLDTQRELESDYNDLQTRYNDLIDNYNKLNLQYDFGIFAYLNEATFIDVTNSNSIYVPNTSIDSWFLEDLREYNVVGYGGYFNLYVFESSTLNPNYHSIYSDLYFNKQAEDLTVNYLPLDLFALNYSNNNGSRVEIISSTDVHVIFNLDSYPNGITAQDVINSNSNFGQYIEEIIITPNNAESMGFYYTNNFYNIGYTNGYSSAYNSYKHYVTDVEILNNRLSEAQSTINSLNNRVSSLSEMVEDNFGWKNLFFAIADTPFKTVSNVLGFELFGLNLFTTFIGMITVLGIVWVIKKLI